MLVLAIETSCDETAIALVEANGGVSSSADLGLKFKILENFVASQIKIHQPFGGVVPNLAKREHLRNLPILYKKLAASGYTPNPDIIAVTVGPGLEPALWTGINFAKELRRTINNGARIKDKKSTPIIGVNHLEGHLYSFLLQQKNHKFKIQNLKFPAIALLVSGGHTILVKMDSLVKYKKIGETRDDAVGESFDKVARLLNLSYPGGPEIEKLAKLGNPDAVDFPRPMLHQKNYDFSFSGLKTAVLYYIRDINLKTKTQNLKPNIAASFQQAVFDVLIKKTLAAAKKFNAESIMVSGGVATNNSLKNFLKLKIKNEKLKIRVFFPEKKNCTDNAAMIAAAGYISYSRKKNRRLTANGNLSI
jgi:N6-L-threonylcarbamoyladenine synthase